MLLMLICLLSSPNLWCMCSCGEPELRSEDAFGFSAPSRFISRYLSNPYVRIQTSWQDCCHRSPRVVTSVARLLVCGGEDDDAGLCKECCSC